MLGKIYKFYTKKQHPFEVLDKNTALVLIEMDPIYTTCMILEHSKKGPL